MALHNKTTGTIARGNRCSNQIKIRTTKVSSSIAHDLMRALHISLHELSFTLPDKSHFGHSAHEVGNLRSRFSTTVDSFIFRSSSSALSLILCTLKYSSRIFASILAISTSSTTTSLQTVFAVFPALSFTLYGTDQRSPDFLTGSPTRTALDRSTRPLYVSSYA